MRWPLNSIRITNPYDPNSHTGNDLAAPEGTPIYAPEAGKVTGVNAGWKPGGYFGGNYVVLTGDSGYRYYMGHMQSVNTYLNARVSEGQVIGLVGQTGNATGPHIHFEMTKDGKTYDPSKLITNQPQGGDMANKTILTKLWVGYMGTYPAPDSYLNHWDGKPLGVDGDVMDWLEKQDAHVDILKKSGDYSRVYDTAETRLKDIDRLNKYFDEVIAKMSDKDSIAKLNKIKEIVNGGK